MHPPVGANVNSANTKNFIGAVNYLHVIQY